MRGKCQPYYSPSERAAIELAKEALYSVAPDFSILGDKLSALVLSLQQLDPTQRTSETNGELNNYRALNANFLQSCRFLQQEAAGSHEASASTLRILEKGMSRPGIPPSHEEILPVRLALSAHECLLPVLQLRRQLVEGEETPHMRDVAYRLDDCLSFIQETLVPSLEKHHVTERLDALSSAVVQGKHRQGQSRLLTAFLGTGITLIATGGFLGLGSHPNRAAAAVATADGIVLAGGLEIARRRQAKQLFTDDDIAPATPSR